MSQDGTGPASRYAFVTLLTTDSYLPGALVLAHTLRRAHSIAHNPAGTLTPADIANLGPAGLSNHVDVDKKVDLVCLVTPATVSIRSVKILLRAFDKVVGVEPLSFSGLAAAQVSASKGRSKDASQREERRAAKKARQHSRKMLALLGRPDLGEASGAALTKLHAWRLTGYDKIVFLDADMLILRPLAHLFSIGSHLAASPDIGWPDAFNSGLIVLTPSLATFSDICNFAISRGSWDGADQGLLNDYFGGDEASGEAGRGGGWQRLPFRYNVTPNAGYTFAPAYERYGRGIMAAHFIGQHKPWNRSRPRQTLNASSSSTRAPADYDSLLLQWHQAYDEYYPVAAAKSATRGKANVVHTERGVEVVETPFTVPTYKAVWDAESDIAASGGESATSANARRGPVRTRGVRAASSANSLLRGAGQAEDLREMFSSNVVAVSVAAEVAAITKDTSKNPNEGVYISMPLDGRISLMGVQWDSGAEDDSPDSDEGTGHAPHQVAQHTAQSSKHAETGSGTWSPPKVSWDPAREPPPVGGGSAEYQMRTPVDAFYVNAWDQSEPRGKAAFFDAPGRSSTAQTPAFARLQREHYFDNLGSDRPDPSLVKAVFPWESKQPSSSSRIFPDEEPTSVMPGSRSLDASLDAGSFSPGESTLSGTGLGRSGDSTMTSRSSTSTMQTMQGASSMGQQHKGLPTSLSYTNAWDQVEGIQKADRRQRGPGNREAQVVPEEGRQGRATQTSAGKYRNRTSQADAGKWEEGQRESYSQYGSGPGGRGLRDASADQSADGDNESSSSSGEGDDDDDVSLDNDATARVSTQRWKREKPGKGYQKKTGKYLDAGEGTPRSPRSQQHASLGSVGGGSGAAGGIVRGGSSAMSMGRSRSSSGSSNPPYPLVSTGNITPAAGGSGRSRRTRTDSGMPLIHDDEEATTPGVDMSLSNAYLGVMEDSSQRHSMAYLLGRNSPMASVGHSAHNSGASSPGTPFSRSPAASRGDLRQLARTHAQAQEPYSSRSQRYPM